MNIKQQKPTDFRIVSAPVKPILFNTEMVRAIQNGTKTSTRRVVKPQPPAKAYVAKIRYSWSWSWWEDSDGHEMKPTYRPGDILYVRETWCDPSGEGYPYLYKADMPMHWDAEDTEIGIPVDLKAEDYKWHPSIHMPREAARMFLRVTDVKVWRVQDITEEEARKEGVKKMYPYTDLDTGKTVYAYNEDGTYITGFACVWNDCYAKPLAVKVKGVIDHYESYPWENIQETRTYRWKPWYIVGNPWVRAIEFEQLETEEALHAT